MRHCGRMDSEGQRSLDDWTYGDTDYDSRLRFVGVDKEGKIMVVDMQVWPKVTWWGNLHRQCHHNISG